MATNRVKLEDVVNEAKSALENGSPDRAIGLCHHIFKHYPRCLEASRVLGEAYTEKRLLDEADQLFIFVLSADPQDVLGYVDRGFIAYERGKVDEAIMYYERALELDPSIEQLREELLRLYREQGKKRPRIRITKVGLANARLHDGIYGQAIEEYNAVLRVMPGRLDVQIGLMEAYWRNRDYPRAEKLASELLQDHPNLVKANLILWHVYGVRRSQDRAAPYLEKAHALDPLNLVADRLFEDAIVSSDAMRYISMLGVPAVPSPDQAMLSQAESGAGLVPDWVGNNDETDIELGLRPKPAVADEDTGSDLGFDIFALLADTEKHITKRQAEPKAAQNDALAELEQLRNTASEDTTFSFFDEVEANQPKIDLAKKTDAVVEAPATFGGSFDLNFDGDEGVGLSLFDEIEATKLDKPLEPATLDDKKSFDLLGDAPMSDDVAMAVPFDLSYGGGFDLFEDDRSDRANEAAVAPFNILDDSGFDLFEDDRSGRVNEAAVAPFNMFGDEETQLATNVEPFNLSGQDAKPFSNEAAVEPFDMFGESDTSAAVAPFNMFGDEDRVAVPFDMFGDEPMAILPKNEVFSLEDNGLAPFDMFGEQNASANDLFAQESSSSSTTQNEFDIPPFDMFGEQNNSANDLFAQESLPSTATDANEFDIPPFDMFGDTTDVQSFDMTDTASSEPPTSVASVKPLSQVFRLDDLAEDEFDIPGFRVLETATLGNSSSRPKPDSVDFAMPDLPAFDASSNGKDDLDFALPNFESPQGNKGDFDFALPDLPAFESPQGNKGDFDFALPNFDAPIDKSETDFAIADLPAFEATHGKADFAMPDLNPSNIKDDFDFAMPDLPAFESPQGGKDELDFALPNFDGAQVNKTAFDFALPNLDTSMNKSEMGFGLSDLPDFETSGNKGDFDFALPDLPAFEASDSKGDFGTSSSETAYTMPDLNPSNIKDDFDFALPDLPAFEATDNKGDFDFAIPDLPSFESPQGSNDALDFGLPDFEASGNKGDFDFAMPTLNNDSAESNSDSFTMSGDKADFDFALPDLPDFEANKAGDFDFALPATDNKAGLDSALPEFEANSISAGDFDFGLPDLPVFDDAPQANSFDFGLAAFEANKADDFDFALPDLPAFDANNDKASDFEAISSKGEFDFGLPDLAAFEDNKADFAVGSPLSNANVQGNPNNFVVANLPAFEPNDELALPSLAAFDLAEPFNLDSTPTAPANLFADDLFASQSFSPSGNFNLFDDAATLDTPQPAFESIANLEVSPPNQAFGGANLFGDDDFAIRVFDEEVEPLSLDADYGATAYFGSMPDESPTLPMIPDESPTLPVSNPPPTRPETPEVGEPVAPPELPSQPPEFAVAAIDFGSNYDNNEAALPASNTGRRSSHAFHKRNEQGPLPDFVLEAAQPYAYEAAYTDVATPGLNARLPQQYQEQENDAMPIKSSGSGENQVFDWEREELPDYLQAFAMDEDDPRLPTNPAMLGDDMSSGFGDVKTEFTHRRPTDDTGGSGELPPWLAPNNKPQIKGAEKIELGNSGKSGGGTLPGWLAQTDVESRAPKASAPNFGDDSFDDLQPFDMGGDGDMFGMPIAKPSSNPPSFAKPVSNPPSFAKPATPPAMGGGMEGMDDLMPFNLSDDDDVGFESPPPSSRPPAFGGSGSSSTPAAFGGFDSPPPVMGRPATQPAAFGGFDSPPPVMGRPASQPPAFGGFEAPPDIGRSSSTPLNNKPISSAGQPASFDFGGMEGMDDLQPFSFDDPSASAAPPTPPAAFRPPVAVNPPRTYAPPMSSPSFDMGDDMGDIMPFDMSANDDSFGATAPSPPLPPRSTPPRSTPPRNTPPPAFAGGGSPFDAGADLSGFAPVSGSIKDLIGGNKAPLSPFSNNDDFGIEPFMMDDEPNPFAGSNNSMGGGVSQRRSRAGVEPPPPKNDDILVSPEFQEMFNTRKKREINEVESTNLTDKLRRRREEQERLRLEQEKLQGISASSKQPRAGDNSLESFEAIDRRANRPQTAPLSNSAAYAKPVASFDLNALGGSENLNDADFAKGLEQNFPSGGFSKFNTQSADVDVSDFELDMFDPKNVFDDDGGMDPFDGGMVAATPVKNTSEPIFQPIDMPADDEFQEFDFSMPSDDDIAAFNPIDMSATTTGESKFNFDMGMGSPVFDKADFGTPPAFGNDAFFSNTPAVKQTSAELPTFNFMSDVTPAETKRVERPVAKSLPVKSGNPKTITPAVNTTPDVASTHDMVNASSGSNGKHALTGGNGNGKAVEVNYLQLAYSYYDEKNYTQSVSHFSTAVKKADTQTLGTIATRLEEIVATPDTNVRYHRVLGDVYQKQGLFQRALAEYSKALVTKK